MPRRHAKRTLATCCTAHTLHDGLSDVTYVLLPLLAQTFGLSLAPSLTQVSGRLVAPDGSSAKLSGARVSLAIGHSSIDE